MAQGVESAFEIPLPTRLVAWIIVGEARLRAARSIGLCRSLLGASKPGHLEQFRISFVFVAASRAVS